ncbi:MAG: DUF58 domain-containing protein, partial [Spirochaetota bacterium]
HTLSLPRAFIPESITLRHGMLSELALDVQMPNIFLGIQVYWELRLRDAQSGRQIHLRYRLRSGPNSIRFPLTESAPWLQAQFRHGLYRGQNQCFYLRDCFGLLHLRYRVKENAELAILSPASLRENEEALSTNTSQDPLSSTIHKFAQEGLGDQRPYHPGDDPRRINWKLYSRFNELHVRIPEERPVFSQDLHCYFILDMACYPKFLRDEVLDQAIIYFLTQLKKLHQNGYRIAVHIPGEEKDILYEESHEEQILRLLATYPQDATLTERDNPLGRLLRSAGNETNNLVFASPHSLSHRLPHNLNIAETSLQEYFHSMHTRYIPLPEPGIALRDALQKKRIPSLLPAALLWHWLLQGRERLPEGSHALKIYRKLGLPITPVSPSSSGKTPIYQPLQPIRYPQLFLRLRAWKRYYRQPHRRYAVRKTKREIKHKIKRASSGLS